MRQADQRCDCAENRRAFGVLAQLPGKHAAVRASRCKDFGGIHTQFGLDLLDQGEREGDIIRLALRPRAGIACNALAGRIGEIRRARGIAYGSGRGSGLCEALSSAVPASPVVDPRKDHEFGFESGAADPSPRGATTM